MEVLNKHYNPTSTRLQVRVGLASGNVAGLCTWVKSMILYTWIAKEVKPKMASLKAAESKLATAMQKLTLALESKERICNQLSENNERRDVEVESHRTHQVEQDARIADLEAQIAEAASAESGLVIEMLGWGSVGLEDLWGCPTGRFPVTPHLWAR